jgi:hypothetical protein
MSHVLLAVPIPLNPLEVMKKMKRDLGECSFYSCHERVVEGRRMCPRHLEYSRHKSMEKYTAMTKAQKRARVAQQLAAAVRREDLRRSRGVCIKCGADSQGARHCAEHREFYIKAKRDYRARHQAAGLCASCPQPAWRPGARLCRRHQDKANARGRKACAKAAKGMP